MVLHSGNRELLVKLWHQPQWTPLELNGKTTAPQASSPKISVWLQNLVDNGKWGLICKMMFNKHVGMTGIWIYCITNRYHSHPCYSNLLFLLLIWFALKSCLFSILLNSFQHQNFVTIRGNNMGNLQFLNNLTYQIFLSNLQVRERLVRG